MLTFIWRYYFVIIFPLNSFPSPRKFHFSCLFRTLQGPTHLDGFLWLHWWSTWSVSQSASVQFRGSWWEKFFQQGKKIVPTKYHYEWISTYDNDFYRLRILFRIRGAAASLATAFNWACTFLVTKTFMDLQVRFHSYAYLGGWLQVGVFLWKYFIFHLSHAKFFGYSIADDFLKIWDKIWVGGEISVIPKEFHIA